MTTLRDIANYSWQGMTPRQKVAVIVTPLIMLALLLAGWIQSGISYFEVRKFERQATHAEADKNDALSKAAAVASEIRRQEGELDQRRKALDDEYKKLAIDRGNRDAAERELERVRAEPRADAPTPDELCNILARAGHPCR